MLSLCSSRVLEIISSIKFYYDIRRIRYIIGSNTICAKLMAGKHGEDMYLLSLMECVSYYQQPADNILELKMGGMVIKFR